MRMRMTAGMAGSAAGCKGNQLTSANKDTLGVGMEQHGRVHQALVVHKLICLCTLCFTIKQQNLHWKMANHV